MADKNTVYMSEKQKVKETTDKLEAGLKELFESEKYKSYLSTMSKFHNYSFNNTLLIAMQKPEATLVAGYQAWQKNFERHVNKGEKAIRILAPAPYKIKEERDKLDPVTGEMMFDERLKEWKYTDKGWFCYELCVPEPPEVSEIVDGSCVIRIKPMTEEQREMSERLVLGLGYQGQNLLCSNWNTENMRELDYNGMFEYLYGMKYGEKFNSEDYPNGIPKEEFESLIMEYLPITAEQIREYAAFDEENQTYLWARLGCFNYAPTFFGTSLPEVVDIKENEDGTVTLTVEAVCDMVICDDAVITHELTVRFAEDGSFQYLGNEILNDGIMDIPDYQYRIRE